MAKKYSQAQVDQAVHNAKNEARLHQIGRSALLMQEMRDKATEAEMQRDVLKAELEEAEADLLKKQFLIDTARDENIQLFNENERLQAENDRLKSATSMG